MSGRDEREFREGLHLDNLIKGGRVSVGLLMMMIGDPVSRCRAAEENKDYHGKSGEAI